MSNTLSKLLTRAMIDHRTLEEKDRAYLFLNLNKILDKQGIPGLHVDTTETEKGLDVKIRLEKNTKVEKPIYMCFGVVEETGDQYLNIDITLENNSSMTVLASCIFPNAKEVKHIMDARVEVGKHAAFNYIERHIHSKDNGTYTRPKTYAIIREDGFFRSNFEMIKGRVGDLEIIYKADLEKNAIFEVDAKVDAHLDDVVYIDEEANLMGDYSRALMTSRAASRDEATVEVRNFMTATGNYCVGHMDCQEILKGNGSVNAVPVIMVKNDTAHITHESALGSVNSKQLETLMSKGLTEEEATEVIISGMLH